VRTRPLERRGRSNHARMARFGEAFSAACANGFDRRVAFQPVPGVDLIFLGDPIRDRPGMPAWKRLTPRFRTLSAIERACFAPTARTRVMGVAEPQMRTLVTRYGTPLERVAVLPPTVSPDLRHSGFRTETQRHEIRAELGVPVDGPLWLWVGLQPRTKGLDRVLDALVRFPDARLAVVGLSEDDKKLAPALKQAQGLDLLDRVHVIGFTDREKVARMLAAADVLTHPARMDMTGTVILEAVVNGLPVVSTSVCGYSTHVTRSGAGRVLQDPFDAGAFVAAIDEICGPANRQFSEKGIAYGKDPALFSGIACAASLIEAPLDRPWPVTECGAALA
jgi:UDP-glucose:(heptosyl)LPS alpha-1,3-glucosyltransferase